MNPYLTTKDLKSDPNLRLQQMRGGPFCSGGVSQELRRTSDFIAIFTLHSLAHFDLIDLH